MNTTTSTIPASVPEHTVPSFFEKKEDYLAFKKQWKHLASASALTRTDAALRILVLGQDATQSMPVTQNPVRLASGGKLASGLNRAMTRIRMEARCAAGKTLTRHPDATTVFASRWLGHGVSREALASLEALAETCNWKELC